MSNNMGFLIFIFFIVIFILLLTGGHIIKYIKNARLKAKKEAREQEQKYRDETGRQQRQYHYSGPTETGETIIDRRAERESKKIYDDSDGEYVEFSEE